MVAQVLLSVIPFMRSDLVRYIAGGEAVVAATVIGQEDSEVPEFMEFRIQI